MKTNPFRKPTRRTFIAQSAAVATAVAIGRAIGPSVQAREQASQVFIVLSRKDPVAQHRSVRWAAERLRDVLNSRGIRAEILEDIANAPKAADCVVASGPESATAQKVLISAGLAIPNAKESLALASGRVGNRVVLLAAGQDARGLVYALLELADRVAFAAEAMAALKNLSPVVEQPANPIRSVARLFTSDVEDKPWFNDREFWKNYLTMLATERFNRFSLTLGIGYDFTTGIRDCYFHFAYPFLLSPRGFNVRAAGLPDAERDQNLGMLRFISDETARRGLDFQLGLWTHAYQWTNSPNANYVIEGLTQDTHAPYCREALLAVLNACPAITGVTFRIHGESGVPEASYEFWKTVFDGVVKCGRRVEIDMHAKGMDQQTIDVALATGLPVNISPKFWAEHMGLPYMQASIRPQEMPPRQAKDSGFFSKSSGSRRFLRYGYGDLLAEHRRYGVLHRIWPGTQRLLLSGDPLFAAGYGRAMSFCGSAGAELCEPLSFKGRKGSGLPGGRDAFADESLRTKGGGWEKFLHTYRMWGRHLYNPDCEPESVRRLLRSQLGDAAEAAEAALASASRILPLITTVHLPSAANNNYWPEIYTNMSIVDANAPHPYSDTLGPKRFGAVSSLDPELFSRIDDFADVLLGRETDGKYSPAEAAKWLEEFSASAESSLTVAKSKSPRKSGPEFRRLSADVAIMCGIGRFFAWKLRAGVLYAIFERSSYPPAGHAALEAYRKARSDWAAMAQEAGTVYLRDITFGSEKQLRGHWLDRLPAIDTDITAMENRLKEPRGSTGSKAQNADPKNLEGAIAHVLAPANRPDLRFEHRPPASFRPGRALTVEATCRDSSGATVSTLMRLHYRQVNQSETWRMADMAPNGDGCTGAIPMEYTNSPFPLQYYFEARPEKGGVMLYPGLGSDLINQPYFVVRSK